MPIWNEGQTETQLIQKVMGGHDVHFSINPNPNTRYLDANGEPIQHDRGFIAELPKVAPKRLKGLLDIAMTAATQVAAATADQLESEGKAGGSTGTILLYDPEHFTISIASRGDSPAFIILDDGKKSVAVSIASGEDAKREVISNALDTPLHKKPTREATYQIGNNPRFTGVIELDTLIKEAVNEHGLDTSTLKTHLMLSSDGIFKPYPDPYPTDEKDVQAMEEAMAIRHYEEAKRIAPNNIAHGMTESAIIDGSQDNLTNEFVANIERGKGNILAMAVADGYYPGGFEVADESIKIIERVMQIETAKSILEEAQIINKRGEYHISLPDPKTPPAEKREILEALEKGLLAIEPRTSHQVGHRIVRETLTIRNPSKEIKSELDYEIRAREKRPRTV